MRARPLQRSAPLLALLLSACPLDFEAEGLRDSGTSADDAATADALPADADTPDVGELDAGQLDGGAIDADEPDADAPDTGPIDTGYDAGPLDGGFDDFGNPVPVDVDPGWQRGNDAGIEIPSDDQDDPDASRPDALPLTDAGDDTDPSDATPGSMDAEPPPPPVDDGRDGSPAPPLDASDPEDADPNGRGDALPDAGDYDGALDDGRDS